MAHRTRFKEDDECAYEDDTMLVYMQRCVLSVTHNGGNIS
jgi:hypothetical protein